MLELPPKRHLAIGIQAFLDLSVLVAAFAAAYLLRFDFHVPPDALRDFITQVPLIVLLQFVSLTIFGARSSIWRYTDLAHIRSFVFGAAHHAHGISSAESQQRVDEVNGERHSPGLVRSRQAESQRSHNDQTS